MRIASANYILGQIYHMRGNPTGKIVKGRNKVDSQGSGTYSYSITLSGFSEKINDPLSWGHPYIIESTYRHVPLEYEGRSGAPITAKSMTLMALNSLPEPVR